MAGEAPPDIFLSYARRDGQTAAAQLRDHLTNPAFTGNQPLAVWQDLTTMRSGQWREQIRAAIKTGDHLLMVLSPGALASEVCAWEWHVARLEGAEISPVLADPALAIEALPRWMTAQHIYRLDLAAPSLAEHAEWQRLVASLRAAPTSRRMPVIENDGWKKRFVPRPTEMDALRDMLLDARGDAVGITTAFTGSGGMGKTTLALALAHDQRIQSAFYGGQLLIELGQQPNLLLVLRTAIQDLTGKVPDAETVKQATEQLAAALADRRVLLVIDDVWQGFHLEPFMQGGPNCARLVTTRDEGVLAKHRGALAPVTVDQMSEAQAVALLGAGLPAEDIAAHGAFLKTLANRLGRCALLLELANGRIWTWSHDRGGLAGAVDEAEIEFRFKGVTAFDTEDRGPVDLSNPATRNEAYADSIAASLDMLSAEHKARFLELAIFPEDTDVPYASIALYWAETAGMDERAAINLLDRLKRMSLVKGALVKAVDPATKGETQQPGIRLHDVIRSYARDPARTQPGSLTELNRRFWKAHVDAGERAFADGTALARYAYERLPWHLYEAGERSLLDALLLQAGWLQGKLDATRNPYSIRGDLIQFGTLDIHATLAQTISLVANILRRDTRQLFPQIISRHRAAGTENNIDRCMADLLGSIVRPALVVASNSLSTPNVELARLQLAQDSPWGYNLIPLKNGDLGFIWNSCAYRWRLNQGEPTLLTSKSVWYMIELEDERFACVSDRKIYILSKEGGDNYFELGEFSDCCLFSPEQNTLVDFSDPPIVWDLKQRTRLTSTAIEAAWHDQKVTSPPQQSSTDGDDPVVGEDVIWRLFVTRNSFSSSAPTYIFISGGSEMAFSRAGRDELLVSWVSDMMQSRPACGNLHIINEASLTFKRSVPTDIEVSALVATRDGRIVAGGARGELAILDRETLSPVAFLPGHNDRVSEIIELSGGNIASIGYDRTLRVWNIKGRLARQQEKHSNIVKAVLDTGCGLVWSGAGDKIRSPEPCDGRIFVWDSASHEMVRAFRAHDDGVSALALLGNGQAVSGSYDGTVRIWDIKSEKEIGRLEVKRCGGALIPVESTVHQEERAEPGQVTGFALLSKQRLAAITVYGEIFCWNLVTGAPVWRVRGEPGHAANGLGGNDFLSNIGKDQLAAAQGSRIKVWDATDDEPELIVQSAQEDLIVFAVLGGSRLASASEGAVQIRDLRKRTEARRVLEWQATGIRALTQLGREWIATGSLDGAVRLWDQNTGYQISCLDLDSPVSYLVAIEDGALVAGCQDGRIHWLDVLH